MAMAGLACLAQRRQHLTGRHPAAKALQDGASVGAPGRACDGPRTARAARSDTGAVESRGGGEACELGRVVGTAKGQEPVAYLSQP